ncbi:group I intron-associated PD-(D/E)XK endonuclease [Spirosoma fluviale]|uniref:PD-(D/E)XK endonuclease n=1 Tax=Spirosoma fluviale TaxID=1597977 RepID=A0A286GNE1_9BACT|nr:group I intron-associated PD-(D/E)XK endonuclease [Spirosoma fluviale]SOD97063.1 PD-(D/E)XK endonuclease [Spirosoma fluviale]
MITKQKGDIAEQAVILQALRLGWGVCKPVGDRLPYDLVFDIDGCLLKIQVKSAWFDDSRGNYVVDNRRTKTNRRAMVRENYCLTDFDFAIIYLDTLHVFYIMPVADFIGYGSEIHLVEADKRQRKPKSASFREAWQLLQTALVAGTLPDQRSPTPSIL